MSWIYALDGTDLASLGYYVNDTAGVFDSVQRSWQMLPITGRAGVMFGAPAREGARTIQLNGGVTTTAKTVAARVTAEHKLKAAARGGLVRLTRTDSTGTLQCIEGYGSSVTLKSQGHPLNATDDISSITLQCRDAYWRDADWTSQALGATRKTLALGTAPSTPMIWIVGSAVNPVLNYRDAGGTIQKTMTFTVTLAATNDWLNIDMRIGKITKYVSGATSVFAPSGDFTWAFDPQDGDYSTSTYPTLEVTAGAGIAYWQKMYA